MCDWLDLVEDFSAYVKVEPPLAVVWCSELSRKWVPYPPTVSKAIEDALVMGKSQHQVDDRHLIILDRMDEFFEVDTDENTRNVYRGMFFLLYYITAARI